MITITITTMITLIPMEGKPLFVSYWCITCYLVYFGFKYVMCRRSYKEQGLMSYAIGLCPNHRLNCLCIWDDFAMTVSFNTALFMMSLMFNFLKILIIKLCFYLYSDCKIFLDLIRRSVYMYR